MKTEAFTKTEYQGFQQAYDFFNRELFDRSLPQVLVTLQRHAKSRGYFSPERFSGRIDETAVHELALNPDAFTGRTDEMILSTLAYEMAHVWQQTHGKPPRRSYHCIFHGCLPPNPGERCHSIHVKPSTQST